MAYEIQIERENDYLSVKAKGDRTLDSVMGMVNEAISVCDDHGLEKIFINMKEMTGQLGTFNSYELVRDRLREIWRIARLKASVVDREENQERFRFVENVAHNNGFRISVFSDSNEALEWLNED